MVRYLVPFGRALGSLAAASPDCAKNSANVTSVTLKDWDIWHSVSATAHLKSSFTISNPGPGEEYKLRNMPFIEDGDWHVCSPSDQLLSECQYRIDTEIGGIGFKLQWRCDA